MATQLSQKRVVDQPQIPDRLYFKIGDVARICSVEPYVLRFWESEFPQLKPNKSGTGQRLYRRGDVELALRIKQLVHGEGYTLAGARQVLQANKKGQKIQAAEPEAPIVVNAAEPITAAPVPPPVQQNASSHATILQHLRQELLEIRTLLSTPAIKETTEILVEPPVSPVAGKSRRARVTQMPNPSGSLFDL